MVIRWLRPRYVRRRWRCEIRRRQLDEKARADRKIVFDVNGAAVLGDDAGGDGETQAGAAILGGKMRQEQAVFVFGRDAVPGVLHADFNGFGLAVGAGGDGDFAEGSGFEGFGGVVDEIDDDAAEQAAVGANRREIARREKF